MDEKSTYHSRFLYFLVIISRCFFLSGRFLSSFHPRHTVSYLPISLSVLLTTCHHNLSPSRTELAHYYVAYSLPFQLYPFVPLYECQLILHKCYNEIMYTEEGHILFTVLPLIMTLDFVLYVIVLERWFYHFLISGTLWTRSTCW